MRQYEMTYLLSDKVNDNEITATTGKINGIITGRKGRILGEENWGRRKLAYPIVKQDFATYITLNFELEPDQLAKIIRDLKLTKEVIRHLIVVKDYGKEELKLSVDEIAETEEIEEVVGGEKSFEAIEGETEQSYDLMAKREETSEESEGDADTADKEIEAEKKPETEEKVTEAEAKPESETIKEEEKVEVEEAEASKPKKRTVKKEKSLEAEVEKEDKKIAKKTIKAEAVDDKKQKAEAEADRLAKLDEEIEGILGDDL
ncbi:MAG: 30S ribosomal protein S6 [bacterium ADurb.Bin212]|nr:MAG: 30S ribosomal protein S6 [bacterium ADurb.Bin212]